MTNPFENPIVIILIALAFAVFAFFFLVYASGAAFVVSCQPYDSSTGINCPLK